MSVQVLGELRAAKAVGATAIVRSTGYHVRTRSRSHWPGAGCKVSSGGVARFMCCWASAHHTGTRSRPHLYCTEHSESAFSPRRGGRGVRAVVVSTMTSKGRQHRVARLHGVLCSLHRLQVPSMGYERTEWQAHGPPAATVRYAQCAISSRRVTLARRQLESTRGYCGL